MRQDLIHLRHSHGVQQLECMLAFPPARSRGREAAWYFPGPGDIFSETPIERNHGFLDESIDERQRQIENAEGRLARADGLLMDIRAGLESLRSQKAVVDQVIVTSGQLTYEAKEAERLLVALRQERDLTQGIHHALKEMRDEDSGALGRTEIGGPLQRGR